VAEWWSDLSGVLAKYLFLFGCVAKWVIVVFWVLAESSLPLYLTIMKHGCDPTHIGPSAQVVWPIVGQEILNGDVGGGFRGIQRTSGFFQILIASKFNLLTKVVLQSLTQIS